MNKYLIRLSNIFMILFLFFSGSIFAIDESQSFEKVTPIQSEKYHPTILVKEFQLSNGMKILLKPTSFEKDEILIELVAKGGFTLFPLDKRASAELSPEVFFESGFSSLTPDQLSVLLYETNNDFAIKVRAFSRSIEALSSSTHLETIFKLIHLTFTKREFDKKSCEIVFEKVKKVLKKNRGDCQVNFLDHCNALNSFNHLALKPLQVEDIEKAQFSSTVQFFDDAFSNPTDFVMVMVGDFDVEKVIPLIEKYLATIPLSSKKSERFNSLKPIFPKGIIHQKIKVHGENEGRARLTFPIQVQLEEKNILPLELACQLIEKRLRERVGPLFKPIKDLDVTYELPLYPCLEIVSIFVEFESDGESAEKIAKMILNEIKILQSQGSSEIDLENAKMQQKESEEYWLKQNDFWLASLSNYSVVGWNIDLIVKDVEKERRLSTEKIKNVLRNYISLDQYTLIWTCP